MSSRTKVGFALLALLVAACGSDGKMPLISNARIGQPTGPNAALYFTATGYGEDDNLISVETDVAPAAELHETVMEDGGSMSMRSLPAIALPASGDLVLEPGGYHVMLVDVDRLEVGASVKLTLTWEKAGAQTIEAEVVDPSDTMGEMGSDS